MLSNSLSLAAPENQNSKDTIKNLNPDYGIKPVSDVKVNARSVRKKFGMRYRRGIGAGNCWTNSAILYNSLKRSGKKVRIIQYRTSLSPRHRSVQIYRKGRWADYNYRGNGYAKRYYATNSKRGVHVIK